MKADKTNGGVNFNDAAHVYWDANGTYDSVTTVIGKFCNEFDKNFWSLYKALESLISPADFAYEKKKLLETKRIDKQYFIESYSLTELDINAAQQDILDEWQKKNEASCDRGTAIHSNLEQQFLSKKECSVKQFGIGGKFNVYSGDVELGESGVYPEYLIHVTDGDLRLAGQIDLLIKDKDSIYIIDYKTNKKLDEKSYFDTRTKKNQMMKYPLADIMDCNKMHYMLQLSTYAWMLQHNYPNLNVKLLKLIHYDHEGNVTEHELDYNKNAVERMLKYWKSRRIIEQKKALRKPIEF